MKNLTKILGLAVPLTLSPALGAFELEGAYWEGGQTTIYRSIDLYGNANSPSGLSWNAAYDQAMSSWESDGSFTFNVVSEFSDPCAGILVPEDGFRNGVSFRDSVCNTDFGDGTLAVTLYYTIGNTFTEADVVFNTAQTWDVYSGAWEGPVSDFRRVAVHELGHVIGLDHEDDVPAIMSTYIDIGDLIEGPTDDDMQGIYALYGADDLAPIILSLEEPRFGTPKSGVSNLRGWVVSLAGIDRIEWYLDGVYKGNIPTGGSRGDVGAAYPDYPGSSESGFSMALNYNDLSSGSHTLELRAYDDLGRVSTQTENFSVIKFNNGFIADPNSVSLASADIVYTASEIRINNLQADGLFYNVVLEWQVATQGFELTSIQQVNN